MKIGLFENSLLSYPKLGGINLYNQSYKRHLQPRTTFKVDVQDEQINQENKNQALKFILGQTIQNSCSHSTNETFSQEDYKKYQNRCMEQIQNILSYFKNAQFQTLQFIEQFKKNKEKHSKEKYFNFCQLFQTFHQKWPEANMNKIKFIQKIKPFLNETIFQTVNQINQQMKISMNRRASTVQQASQTNQNFQRQKSILKKNLQQKIIQYNVLYGYKKNILEERDIAQRCFQQEVYKMNEQIDAYKKKIKEKDEEIKKLKKYTKEMTDKLFKNVLMFHPFRNQQINLSESSFERHTSKSFKSDDIIHENIFLENKIIQNLKNKFRKNNKKAYDRCLTSVSMLIGDQDNNNLQQFLSKSTKEIILQYWNDKKDEQERQLKSIISNKRILRLLNKYNYKIVKNSQKSFDGEINQGDSKKKPAGKVKQIKKTSIFKQKNKKSQSLVKQNLEAQYPELREKKGLNNRLIKMDSYLFNDIQEEPQDNILQKDNIQDEQDMLNMQVSQVFRAKNQGMKMEANYGRVIQYNKAKIAKVNQKKKEQLTDSIIKNKNRLNNIFYSSKQSKKKKVHFNSEAQEQIHLQIYKKVVDICISSVQKEKYAQNNRPQHKKYKSNLIDMNRQKNKSQNNSRELKQTRASLKPIQFNKKQQELQPKINKQRKQRNTIKKQSVLNNKKQSFFTKAKERLTLKDTEKNHYQQNQFNYNQHTRNISHLQRFTYKEEDEIQPQMRQRIEIMARQYKNEQQFMLQIKKDHYKQCGNSCDHIKRYLQYFEELLLQNKLKKSIKINIEDLNLRSS